jgi:hypothetical protein
VATTIGAEPGARVMAGSRKEFDAFTAAASHNRAFSKSLSQRPEHPSKRTYLAAGWTVRLRANKRHMRCSNLIPAQYLRGVIALHYRLDLRRLGERAEASAKAGEYSPVLLKQREGRPF